MPNYTLSISIDGGGTVIGGGSYKKGETVNIIAIPSQYYIFGFWDGDVSGNENPKTIVINYNMEIIAKFIKKDPCRDIINSRSNPLLSMSILGSRNNGLRGGMWGTARGRMHYGIDLNAGIGEPIYAMFDGTIERIIDHYDPNIPFDKYDETYPDESYSNYAAGNRVQIRSIVNGKIITQKYFHMNSIIITQGPIQAGDIIGYVGNTGSASSKDSNGPHLHLEIYVNGVRQDPRSYLYTIFDDNGNITRDCNF